MDVPAYKIGSGECNNLPLIDHIADFGKPIIVSTGMNTLNSVRETVNLLKTKSVDLHFFIQQIYILLRIN